MCGWNRDGYILCRVVWILQVWTNVPGTGSAWFVEKAALAVLSVDGPKRVEAEVSKASRGNGEWGSR